MTDKERIRAEIERLLKEEACGNEIAVYNDLLSFIDSLQEEPVSEDLNTESMIESYKQKLISQANGMKNSPLIDMCLVSYKHGINETLDTLKLSNIERTVKNWEEPTTEDLGEYINELSKQFPEVSFAKLSRIAVRVAKWQEEKDNEEKVLIYKHGFDDCKEQFEDGAKWKVENLWKPADGDDLPETDREVIALEGIVDPTATDCFCGYKVVFAHRPTPEGYDGKSIATGVVEHYTPETYGEGGWNVPNIAYWLNIELPKEIEL